MQQPTKTLSLCLKLTLTALFSFGALTYCFFGPSAAAFSGGPPASRTLAPALGTFPVETTCNACHQTFPLNSGPGVLTISPTFNGQPVFTYTPGQEITVTVTVTQADRGRYGFEAQVLDDQGRRAGDLLVTDASRTRTVDGAGNFIGRQYIQHILAGVAPSGPNQGSWSFTWKAPAQSVGRVTFYVAGNAASNGNGNQQDYIYTTSLSLQPAGGIVIGSAASLVQTGNTAADGIISIFGANLADSTASATLPLPTNLGGASVKVRDASGTDRDARLFFASPQQINLLVPAGTATGIATVTVMRGNTTAGTSTILVEGVAPALFSANANGQGVAAAYAVRVSGGVQTFVPVVQFNMAANRYDAVPIDLGPEGDQVVLVLFGSQFRARTGTNSRALIGTATAEVQFAGAQGDLAGLDQANILIPRSLVGSGNVNVGLTIDNRRANLVTINIK